MDKLREEIARICGDAKYADGAGVSWEYYGDYERGLALDKANEILSLIRQHIPEDKVKAVKEILDQHYGESPDGMGNLYIATQICQLFERPKVKLPEIPYIDELEYGDATCHDFRWGANVTLKEVKEALEKAGVEVEK